MIPLKSFQSVFEKSKDIFISKIDKLGPTTAGACTILITVSTDIEGKDIIKNASPNILFNGVDASNNAYFPAIYWNDEHMNLETSPNNPNTTIENHILTNVYLHAADCTALISAINTHKVLYAKITFITKIDGEENKYQITGYQEYRAFHNMAHYQDPIYYLWTFESTRVRSVRHLINKATNTVLGNLVADVDPKIPTFDDSSSSDSDLSTAVSI